MSRGTCRGREAPIGRIGNRADQQHVWIKDGDERGVFGEFPTASEYRFRLQVPYRDDRVGADIDHERSHHMLSTKGAKRRSDYHVNHMDSRS